MNIESEGDVLGVLPSTATDEERRKQYDKVKRRIDLLVAEEQDLVAVLATVACELHQAFDYYHWTVRGTCASLAKESGLSSNLKLLRDCADLPKQQVLRNSLVIGPYQGSLGCLRIPVGTGVCGAAALQRQTQLVSDVHEFPGHIACSSSTESEVVVPYFSGGGELLGVLDVDSNLHAAFSEADQKGLESVCNVFKAWNAFHEYVA